MRRLSRQLGVAVSAELRDIGNEVRDHIRSSTDPPYASSPGQDSKGIQGRKRRSIKTSVRRGGVSLYSLEPDAGVWQWGGSIKPRGTPIRIPRTEFVSKQVEKDAPMIEARLGGVLEATARRYGEFT
jgi:hypothetical protein